MTSAERFFHALGVGYTTVLACWFAWGVACWAFHQWRQRRERQAIIDSLIRGARVSPRWIVAETKGRG